jgi:DNA-binding NarL/FixJ family response regulator
MAAVEVLTGLARLAARRQPERAVRLFAAVAAFGARAGLVPARALREQNEAALAAAGAALGEAAFAAAWAAGQSLSPAEVVGEAKAVADAPAPPARTGPVGRPAAAPFGLTARELEVLQLLVDGRADREIADALFLSPRTVHHHVANVLAKLGAANRVGAVEVARAAGLLSAAP